MAYLGLPGYLKTAFGTLNSDALDLRTTVDSELGAEIEEGGITLHISNVQHADSAIFSHVKLNLDLDLLDRLVQLRNEL